MNEIAIWIALFAAVLSLVNTWHVVNRDRVRLRVDWLGLRMEHRTHITLPLPPNTYEHPRLAEVKEVFVTTACGRRFRGRHRRAFRRALQNVAAARERGDASASDQAPVVAPLNDPRW